MEETHIGRKDGQTEERNIGRKDGRKEGRNQRRKETRKEGRKEGGDPYALRAQRSEKAFRQLFF